MLLIIALAVFLLGAPAPRGVVLAREMPSLSLPHVPGEILVRWAAEPRGARPERTRAILRDAVAARVVDAVPHLAIERWRVPPQRMAHALRTLQSSPAVAWAEPNYTFSLPAEPLRPATVPKFMLDGFLFPNDPYYVSYARQYLQRLGVESAWAVTLGDPRIIVAVVDTGVDCEHEDLRGHCWVNVDEIPGNGVDDDGNGYVDDRGGWNFFTETPDPGDVHYHGTHVSGIVAATINNGKGIAGIAPGVTIMPVGVFSPLGVGTYYDLIRGVVYAVDNGAHVINLSLGATTYSRGEAEAMAYAERHGVVVVAAAGNNGSNRLFYPAAHPQVIAVAATNASDIAAGFSNHGAYVTVAAPGVAVISTTPGNRYGLLSGTSMATPHVSGLAALLLSRDPSLSPKEVRSLIITHADDRVGPPTMDTPGWDPYYGFGRIHVGRTVSAAPHQAGTPSTPPPGEAPLLPWTPSCRDIVSNGGFEDGAQGWTVERAEVVQAPVYAGGKALRLESDRAARATQTLALPDNTLRATFFAAVRIETADAGEGPSPEFPFDDWLKVRLVSGEEDAETLLLFAGNTSDSVRYGLAWDEVVAVLPAGALPARAGPVRLVLETGSDGDGQPTTFTVDEVRLCVVQARIQYLLPVMGLTP